MVNMNNAFPSKYIAAGDLNGKDVTLPIASVVMEEVGRDKEICPVMYFTGAIKGMVLNRTNGQAIAEMYGQESDLWTGKSVTIFPTQTDWGGRIVPCIRVRLLTPNEAGVAPAVVFDPSVAQQIPQAAGHMGDPHVAPSPAPGQPIPHQPAPQAIQPPGIPPQTGIALPTANVIPNQAQDMRNEADFDDDIGI